MTVVDNLFLGQRGEPVRSASAARRRVRFHGRTRPTTTRCRRSCAPTRPRSSSTWRSCRCPPRWSGRCGASSTTSASPLVPCELLRTGAFETLIHVLVVGGLRLGEVRADGRGAPAGAVDAVRGQQARRRPGRRSPTSTRSGSTRRSSGPSTTSGRARTPAAYAGIIPIVVSRATAGEPIADLRRRRADPRLRLRPRHRRRDRARSTTSRPPGAASSTWPVAARSSVNELVRTAARRARRRRAGPPRRAPPRRRAPPLGVDRRWPASSSATSRARPLRDGLAETVRLVPRACGAPMARLSRASGWPGRGPTRTSSPRSARSWPPARSPRDRRSREFEAMVADARRRAATRSRRQSARRRCTCRWWRSASAPATRCWCPTSPSRPRPTSSCSRAPVPVLVDIDLDDLHVDPGDLERRITPRTKAIMPVHPFGLSADMDPILAFAAGARPRRGRGCGLRARRHLQRPAVGSLGDARLLQLPPAQGRSPPARAG